MKLSKIDLRILMIIRKEGSPMPNYKIAQSLKKNPGQITRRLKLLEKNHILTAANSWPKFYTFNSNNAAQDYIIQTAECPTCKKLHILHHAQQTVQCTCSTQSGKLRRFYISEKSIIDKKVLTKQAEIKPADEIEQDVNEIMGPA